MKKNIFILVIVIALLLFAISITKKQGAPLSCLLCLGPSETNSGCVNDGNTYTKEECITTNNERMKNIIHLCGAKPPIFSDYLAYRHSLWFDSGSNEVTLHKDFCNTFTTFKESAQYGYIAGQPQVESYRYYLNNLIASGNTWLV